MCKILTCTPSAANTAAVRLFGTDLLTARIDLHA